MKLYDENNELHSVNDPEQNENKNTNAPETNGASENTEVQSDETTFQAKNTQESSAQSPSPAESNPAQMPTAEPQQTPAAGSYSYTHENIPENTYRPNPGQNSSPYARPDARQNQNGYSYPQNNPGAGQNPYGQYNNPPQNQGNPYGYNNNPYSQQQPRDNGYAQQNGGYGQPYGYQQNPGYNPVQDGSRISYTPDKNAARKAKKKGSGRKAAVAVACCCGLLLSTGFGFLGAVIANRMFPAGSAEEIVVDTEGNVVNETMNTAVFYKSVENITTSTKENGGDLTLAQVSALVSDTVVEITTEFVNTSSWFQYISTGAGSGVILSTDGYVITNNHVICGDDGTTPADTITVRLTNGEE
ncbi:MAG: hypothetical protein IKY52_14965, partial [Clostridia bacterium]|nr:hypothetical protein [Clostridia bacterium]